MDTYFLKSYQRATQPEYSSACSRGQKDSLLLGLTWAQQEWSGWHTPVTKYTFIHLERQLNRVMSTSYARINTHSSQKRIQQEIVKFSENSWKLIIKVNKIQRVQDSGRKSRTISWWCGFGDEFLDSAPNTKLMKTPKISLLEDQKLLVSGKFIKIEKTSYYSEKMLSRHISDRGIMSEIYKIS